MRLYRNLKTVNIVDLKVSAGKRLIYCFRLCDDGFKVIMTIKELKDFLWEIMWNDKQFAFTLFWPWVLFGGLLLLIL